MEYFCINLINPLIISLFLLLKSSYYIEVHLNSPILSAADCCTKLNINKTKKFYYLTDTRLNMALPRSVGVFYSVNTFVITRVKMTR